MSGTTRRQVIAGGTGLALTSLAGPAFGAAAASGRWRSAAPLPIATQEVYPAANKGTLYVAGGIAQGTLTPYIAKDVQAYDPAADKWSEGPKLPEERHHISLASHTDRLYAIGGYYGSLTGGVWQIRDTVWRLSEDGKAWESVATMPKAHAEMITAVLGDKIHLIGGRRRKSEGGSRSDYVDINDHVVFDPVAGSWETLRPDLTERNSAATALIDGKIYVAGGRNATGNVPNHSVYDPKTDQWAALAPMPKPQAGLGGAALGGRFYVFGGEIFQPEAAVFADVWEYDPAKDAWTAMASMPTPRHGHGAVTIGEEIFVVAGAIRPGGSGRSTANEVFKPD